MREQKQDPKFPLQNNQNATLTQVTNLLPHPLHSTARPAYCEMLDDMVNIVLQAIETVAEDLEGKMGHLLHETENDVESKKDFFMRNLCKLQHHKGKFCKQASNKIESFYARGKKKLRKTVINVIKSIKQVQILLDSYLQQSFLIVFQYNLDQDIFSTELSQLMILASDFAQGIIIKTRNMKTDVGQILEEGKTFLQLMVSDERFQSNEAQSLGQEQNEVSEQTDVSELSDEEDVSELSDGQDVSESSELLKRQVELEDAEASIQHFDAKDVSTSQSSEERQKEQRPESEFEIAASGSEEDGQGYTAAGHKKKQDDENDQVTQEVINRRVHFPSPEGRKVTRHR